MIRFNPEVFGDNEPQKKHEDHLSKDQILIMIENHKNEIDRLEAKLKQLEADTTMHPVARAAQIANTTTELNVVKTLLKHFEDLL